MTNPTRRSLTHGWERWARRARATAVVAVVVAGGALVGIAVHQHLQRNAAVSAQAARRQWVDRRARAEARADGHPSSADLAPGAAGKRSRSAAGGTPPAETIVPSPGSPGGPVSAISGSGATLVVPALGVQAPIVATGGVDGSMVVPADIHDVGWYDGIDSATAGAAATAAATSTHRAPWPGQPGVAVLAGHVDWAGQGPGALYYLDQLKVGDPIQVVGSNGQRTAWRVSQPPVTLSKSALPASLFVDTGPAKLALVTCGGPFDAATGHYLDNVIVWAAP